MSEKKQLLILRIFIAVFIGISVAIAIIQYKASLGFIAQLMGISWGALAGAFLGPFLYGLYWKRTSKASIWVCFCFSVVVMVANMVAKPIFPELLQSPINCGVFCMFAGLIIVPVVSLFTKAPNQAHVEQVFSCYDKKVVVSAKEAIGDPVHEED